jgi:hypothetical protein
LNQKKWFMAEFRDVKDTAEWKGRLNVAPAFGVRAIDRRFAWAGPTG